MAVDFGSKSKIVRFYIGGRPPSARDISNLLRALEAALVWGPLAAVLKRHEAAQEAATVEAPAKGESSKQAAIVLRDKLDTLIRPIQSSFWRFLEDRYREVLTVAITAGKEQHQRNTLYHNLDRLDRLIERAPKDQQGREERFSPSIYLFNDIEAQYIILNLLVSKQIGGALFSFSDFSDWIGENIGRNGLVTQSVREGSLEFIFDAAVILSFLSLQDYIAVKESVIYALQTLKSWIGSQSAISQPRGPELDKHLLRTMAKYDRVELEVKSDGGYRISFERDSSSSNS